MNLRMLLEHPDLELEVLVAPPDPARPVRWVYTTDQVDPRRYLSGGELVLTGLVWWREPGDAEPFVAALAEAGVAALAAGATEHAGVPEDVVQACRAHGLPLFEVPMHVSFAALTEFVVLGAARERASGVTDLASALASASAVLGGGCWVLTPTGRVVAGTGAPPAAGVRRGLARAYLRADRLPTVARGEYSLVETGVAGVRAADWFLAVRGDRAMWTESQRQAVVALVDAATAERSTVDDARRSGRADALLGRLSEDPGAAPDLAATGVGFPVCVLSASASAADLAATVLHELAASHDIACAVGEVRGGTFAVLGTGGSRETAAKLSEAVRLLHPGLGDARLAVGISAESGPSGLPRAFAEARNARTAAERRGSGVEGAAGLGAFHSLLAAVPSPEREAFRRWVLGPVLDYDTEHQSDLVHTLRQFLAASGSWTRAAERLHVHVNTLRYRIGRIEDLTGRDLADLAAQADFLLALEL